MAIKIIKPGKKEIAVYSAKCSNCNCEFEFNKEDAVFGEYRESKYLTINCPHCKVKIQSLNVNPCRYDMIECKAEK